MADQLRPLPRDADEDDETLVWVDHREEEEALLCAFAERLPAAEGLEPFWRGDALWLRWRGAEHRLPLTFSPVDRYVAIHSLAELLAPDYRILVQRESLGGDTHGFLLLAQTAWETADAATRARLDADFEALEPGIDAFSGLAVPYLGHDDRNPDAAAQRKAQSDQADGFVRELMQTPQMQAGLFQMREEIAALAPATRRQRWLRALVWGLLIFVCLRLLRSFWGS